MLLKDKYIPIYFKEYIIHKNLVSKLNNLLKYDIQNIIFYGPNGCGKTTLYKSLLCELYNNNITTTKKKISIKILNNSKDIYINHCEYYFEILIDKYLIYNKQYLIKLINILTETYDINEKCKFKIIIIKNIDLLQEDFYLYIKNCIEKKNDSVRFIFTTNNISKILNNYKGFFLLQRVPEPNKTEKNKLVKHILNDNNIKFNNILIKKLINNNLLNILIKLELLIYNKTYIFHEDKYITQLFKLIIEKKINNILTIRETLYELLALNYNFKIILNILLKMFLNYNITSLQKKKIIQLYNNYNNNNIKSYKHIIIVESLLINIMNIL